MESSYHDDPLYLAYLEAWRAPDSGPDIRALSVQYLNDTITPERALSKVLKARRAVYLAANPAARYVLKRSLLHAQARWWAATVREQERSKRAPDYAPPEGGDHFAPVVTLQSIIMGNNANRATRLEVRIEQMRAQLRPVEERYREAKRVAGEALLTYRLAAERADRALMEARIERGVNALAPKSFTSARAEAAAQLEAARAARKALQVEVRHRKVAIASLECRRKRIMEGRHPLKRTLKRVKTLDSGSTSEV